VIHSLYCEHICSYMFVDQYDGEIVIRNFINKSVSLGFGR
jgi:hypothetical protein